MGFQNIAGLRGVVGAIDGTHIRISRPYVDEEVYVNRKGYHSTNVQVCNLQNCAIMPEILLLLINFKIINIFY